MDLTAEQFVPDPGDPDVLYGVVGDAGDRGRVAGVGVGGDHVADRHVPQLPDRYARRAPHAGAEPEEDRHLGPAHGEAPDRHVGQAWTLRSCALPSLGFHARVSPQAAWCRWPF